MTQEIGSFDETWKYENDLSILISIRLKALSYLNNFDSKLLHFYNLAVKPKAPKAWKCKLISNSYINPRFVHLRSSNILRFFFLAIIIGSAHKDVTIEF